MSAVTPLTRVILPINNHGYLLPECGATHEGRKTLRAILRCFEFHYHRFRFETRIVSVEE